MDNRSNGLFSVYLKGTGAHMTTIRYFKIRHANGQFSKGGTYPVLSEKGKNWSSLAALKAHLKLTNYGSPQRGPSERDANWEIIEYEVTVREVSRQPLEILQDEIRQAEDSKRQKVLQAARQRQETYERALAQSLLAKYPDLKD
jgi:hypothetical protein